MTPRVNGDSMIMNRLDSFHNPTATPRNIPSMNFNASPENRSLQILDRSSWLPSPRMSFAGNYKFQNTELSILDGSVVSRQVLETQEPEFISKLENSLIQIQSEAGRKTIIQKHHAVDEGDLESEISRAEAMAQIYQKGALRPEQDMEAEEVWEALMLWCSSHDSALDQHRIEELGK